MDSVVKKLFCEKLRSGEYRQCTNHLRFHDTFCALGVLSDVSGLGEWVIHSPAYTTYRTGANQRTGCLTPEVKDWAGLTTHEEDRLAELNDGENRSFSDIADYVEKNY